jgi:Trypsin-co-occurring domain 2
VAEVPLAQAIKELRAQLLQAIDAGKDEPLRFELDSVVLELQVALTTSGSAEAKVGLWSVLTLGASGDHSRGTTHRLTLTLSPRLADARPGEKTLIDDDTDGPPPAADASGWGDG